MQAKGDRFISQRSAEFDSALLFGTKLELFSSPYKSPDKTQLDSEMQEVNVQQQQQDTELVTQEESKKTYRALLQNQVLGIDNPYLLNEIHNSEDFLQKENLYSQM